MLWSKSQQYRHLAPWNAELLPSNCNLYDLWAGEQVEPRVLWGVLNSTVVALTKPQFGRTAGIEGNLKTEVIDVNMMLVPDPRRGTERIRERLVQAARRLGRRLLSRTLVEEFDFEDRRELDDAVLELLGMSDAEERASFREKIYQALREQYEATRTRELEAQRDRLRSKRKGVASAADLADEIWQSEGESFGLQEFPADFLRDRKGLNAVDLPPGRVEVGKGMMETGRDVGAGRIRVGGPDGDVLDVGSRAAGEFLAAAAECGLYGRIAYPSDESHCTEAIGTFREYCSELRKRFRELAGARTRDKKRQQAIVAALMRRALGWRRGESPDAP